MYEHLQDHLAAIVQSADDAIISKTIDGIIMFWNKGAERIFGYTSEEVLGKSINILSPDKKDEHKWILEKFNKGEKLEHFETKRIKKDGSVLEVSLTVSPIYDHHKKVVGFSTIGRDVTKTAQYSQYVRSLIEASLDPFIIMTVGGNITDLNEASVNILGIPRDKLIGADFANYCTEPEKARESYHLVFEKGPVLDYPLIIKHANGKLTDVLCNASVYKDNLGNIIGLFVAARDMTENKKKEKQFQLVSEGLASNLLQLKESEEQTQTIFKRAPGAVIVIDQEGKITNWNPKAEIIFGWTANEVIGQYLHEIIIPEKYRDAHQKGMKHFMKTGEGPVLNRPIELPALHKNNTEFDAEISISPMFVNGKYFFIGFISNISYRKQAEALILKKSEDLANSNQELEQFAYVASHDLQEPLRTIHNFTGLIEKKHYGKLDAETDQYLYFIVNAVSKMQNLIKDLLEFSRIGRNIILVDVDCNSIVKEVTTEMKVSIEEKHVRITSSVLPVIKGCEIEIKRLFQNLISNAIKFQKKEIAPEITITAEEKDAEYVFAFKDNGIGIEEKHINKLFIIFQRLNDNSQYPGTGIGLAICKKIVTLHGGKIWVKSKLDEGSTFYFSISKKNSTQHKS